MAKSAQQRLNEFWDESRLTRNAVKSLSDATHAKYGSYSYTAGYFESLVSELIMQLPKAQREHYRTQLIQAAQSYKVNS